MERFRRIQKILKQFLSLLLKSGIFQFSKKPILVDRFSQNDPNFSRVNLSTTKDVLKSYKDLENS
ncbi:hypothetical protein JWG44_14305 [Leptospira sp. 201903071]|uniref:hypothetical protein n=1 Tax=Leptospira ainazelensis TaxID=2810034 RepID=UPI0019627BA3|nr:hypothetical protein [Leptospira ainazelensis]MBM9501424.1 hypothetical protein [Leptospira ainazelensis]